MRTMSFMTHERDSKGESEHKLSKSRYQRTSGKNVNLALSKVERRQRTIQVIRNTLSPSFLLSSRRHTRKRKEKILDPMFSPKMQYNIGQNEASPVDVPVFLSRNHGDPAVSVRTPISLRRLPVLNIVLLSCLGLSS